uniref:t-SNARE coiled-coil homology domain-containing protein n=1 Tax=Panagrolaimus sp. JU765 TaxID=591449 RepID=A0AC34QZC8_9BILA
MANPFDDDNRYSGRLDNVRSYTKNTTVDDELNEYERQIEQILQESVDSTERSKQRLAHSEQLGVNTAQELLSQREKLERTEKNLDDINRTTYETQRNLNSLKSLFGGWFKNKFSKTPSAPSVPVSKSENKLSSHLSSTSSDSRFVPSSSGPTLSAESRNAIKGTRFEAIDNQIDENLDEMSLQLQKLKNIGKALGDEVEDQNQMLSRIQVKADRNDIVVRSQDNQMKKLLGYSGVPAKAEDTAALPAKKK